MGQSPMTGVWRESRVAMPVRFNLGSWPIASWGPSVFAPADILELQCKRYFRDFFWLTWALLVGDTTHTYWGYLVQSPALRRATSVAHTGHPDSWTTLRY